MRDRCKLSRLDTYTQALRWDRLEEKALMQKAGGNVEAEEAGKDKWESEVSHRISAFTKECCQGHRSELSVAGSLCVLSSAL